MKYPRISWEIGWCWGLGDVFRPPTPLKDLPDRYKDDMVQANDKRCSFSIKTNYEGMLALGDFPEGGGDEGARTPLLLHLSANPTCVLKVLVEKLLRTTNVKRLYLLIRPKRGVNTAARLEQLLASRLFDRYVL
jgi:hypothetical protein